MTEKRVLIIEDEPGLVMTLTDRLHSEGYAVEAVRDGEAGYRKASSSDHDIILMDIGLPGRDGLSICSELRAQGTRTPILMLTARGDVMDRVMGLKNGADDYLPKPFEMVELVARIEALLRRSAGANPESFAVSGRDESSGSGTSFSFGQFRLDPGRQLLLRNGTEIPLSTQEFRLLHFLVRNPGRVFDRNELLDSVWDYNAIPNTRTVDVHIAWIRHKIGDSPHPHHIITVRKRGYKFVF